MRNDAIKTFLGHPSPTPLIPRSRSRINFMGGFICVSFSLFYFDKLPSTRGETYQFSIASRTISDCEINETSYPEDFQPIFSPSSPFKASSLCGWRQFVYELIKKPEKESITRLGYRRLAQALIDLPLWGGKPFRRKLAERRVSRLTNESKSKRTKVKGTKLLWLT